MASKDKQTGLTAESLMKAQQQLIESGKLTEEQLKLAKEQLAKLEELVNAFKAESALNTAMERKSEKAIEIITQTKKDPSHVTLGNVRDEVKNLAKTIEGKEPKSGRAPLPQVWRQGEDRAVMSTGGTAPTENIGSKERIQKIGGVIPGSGRAPQAKSGGGNIISDKILTDIERSRSPTYDKFMDLMVGKPNVGGGTNRVGQATARVKEPPSLKTTAQIINITAKSVNVKGTITGGQTNTPTFQTQGPSKSGGRGSQAEPKPVAAPAPAAPAESSGPGLLSTAATAALGYGSKAGSMIKSGAGMLGRGTMAAGRGALGMGKTALQLGGRALATPVGATLAAGAAMYGVGRAVDYGAGKLGVGKDAEGKDIQTDKKADDANWNRMKWYHKAESGMARGIEKVGSFVAPNMARQAEADRIKKETAGLDTIESNEAKNRLKKEGKGWSAWSTKNQKAQDSKDRYEAVHAKSKMAMEAKSWGDWAGKQATPMATQAFPLTPAPTDKPKPAAKPAAKSAPKAAAPAKGKAEPKSKAAKKDEKPQVEEVLMVRHAKLESNKIGGRTIPGYEGGYDLMGKSQDVRKAEALWRIFDDADFKDDVNTANAAAKQFVALADMIKSPQYQQNLKELSDKQKARDAAAAEAAKSGKGKVEPGNKPPAVASGRKVAAASAENADIKSKPPAPTIINTQQAGNHTVNNTTNNVMPRGDVRPNESAMERYANKQSHFY